MKIIMNNVFKIIVWIVDPINIEYFLIFFVKALKIKIFYAKNKIFMKKK